MTRTERTRLFLFAAAATAWLAACAASGAHDAALISAPVFLLLLPLIAGRYVGEERIERLAQAWAGRERRPRTLSSRIPAPRPRAVLARGGRLIGTSLAVRPPPLSAAL